MFLQMSKLLCNVLKFSGRVNAPNAPPGCAPGGNQCTNVNSTQGTTNIMTSTTTRYNFVTASNNKFCPPENISWGPVVGTSSMFTSSGFAKLSIEHWVDQMRFLPQFLGCYGKTWSSPEIAIACFCVRPHQPGQHGVAENCRKIINSNLFIHSKSALWCFSCKYPVKN